MQLYMRARHLTGRLLRWGNSYGIRLRKADVENAGFKEGADVIVSIVPKMIDLSHLPILHDREGRTDISEHHDEIIDEEIEADFERVRRSYDRSAKKRRRRK